MNDDEIKPLFEKIKVNLNKEFSLPDKLIQDFINDGSIKTTFMKCTKFDNHHFNQLISHIKHKNKMIKKLPPKPSSKKKNKNEKGMKNEKRMRNEKRKTKRIKRIKS
jgi:hypothetical protein